MLQQVGDFGWLDTPMPNGVYIRVLLAVMFLAFTAFLRLSPRQMVTVGWLFLAQYFLPIVLQAVQFNTNGLVWQGRYTLPLTVMLPVFLMMYAAPRLRAQHRSPARQGHRVELPARRARPAERALARAPGRAAAQRQRPRTAPASSAACGSHRW